LRGYSKALPRASVSEYQILGNKFVVLKSQPDSPKPASTSLLYAVKAGFTLWGIYHSLKGVGGSPFFICI